MQASFLGCSRNGVVQSECTQERNNHGRAEDCQGNRGTITITKRIVFLIGKVATRASYRKAIEEGETNDELVSWAIQIHVLQVGQADSHD